MKINIISLQVMSEFLLSDRQVFWTSTSKNSRMMSGGCSLPPSRNDMSLFKLECTLKVEGMTIHIEEQVVTVFMLCVLLA